MSNIENINEADQLILITEEDNSYSDQNIEICLSNLKNSDSGLTPEEEYQFCHMVCTEDKNAEICSILIESDSQII